MTVITCLPMTYRLTMLFLLVAAGGLAGDGFVLIRGGLAVIDKADSRVEDFEILDHPVTNAGYQVFVKETGHAAPLHWEGGTIPAGMENWPVVFVNRYDVAAYLKWRSKKENRIYRLPLVAEFEYAARAGSPNTKYPWGDAPPQGRANYDPAGDRTFGEWRRHLRPVRSYSPNAWGLHDMAGNVWQMADTDFDFSQRRFIYRLESHVQKEGTLIGGSWARSEYYLRCGVRGSASSGIRHPDIGFRPVREPVGSAHFRRQPRRVIAASAGGGVVYLGWQLLPDDAPGTGFHVYRSSRRDTAGERITPAPVMDSTNFVDSEAHVSSRVYYRVRAVTAAGTEGPPSEWAGITLPAERSNLVAVFEPTAKEGGFVPVFGDLDGDGVLDAVLRLDNGIREMSRDPGVPVELEAFTSYGRSLWRRPLVRHENCHGNANNVPVAVYDLDGDAKSEIICRLEEDRTIHLAVLDGMTGAVVRKTRWTEMLTDHAGSSTRIHIGIAYLDGRHPAIVTQTGLYENEVFEAFDASLNKLWTFRSLAETNGSGSHHVDIADVDGDGKDEVFDGTTVLNSDGTLRWSIYREHPDIVAVKRILPDAKVRQVFFAVESATHAGAYVVDASSGKIHWKLNREDDPRWSHAHTGWASDIWAGSPGMEMLTNRDGHETKDLVLFAAQGKILLNPFPQGWRPVDWRGGAVRDLLSNDGQRLGEFNGKEVAVVPGVEPNPDGQARCNMVADLAGDFRDEIVCFGKNIEGQPAVLVYTNIEPARSRQVTRTASREYRLWLARNMGAGYASYFEWQP